MKRFVVTVVTGAAVVMALVGCSGGSEAAAPAPTKESFSELNYRLMRNHAECLHERGWTDVTVQPDGGFTFGAWGISDEEYTAMQPDWDDCYAQEVTPYMPEFDGVTEEAASAYFDAQLEVADCVRELGFTVPEPPSRGAFVESTVNQDGVAQWDPLNDVGGALPEAIAQCGQPNLLDFM